MRKQPGKWWRGLTAFWDWLCALREHGVLWLLHQREALGVRRRAHKAPPRRSFRPCFEVLEDVLAPGNLLSAASAFGVEAPPNSDVPPVSSAPATPAPTSDTPASAEGAGNEDTDPAPRDGARTPTRSASEETGPEARNAEEGTQPEEAPKQPALRGDGLGDPLRAGPMGEDPLRNPVENEDVLPAAENLTRGAGGDSGSSAGSHEAAATSGPGEGSSGSSGAGSASNSASAFPAHPGHRYRQRHPAIQC
jgi:hypothetical protein